MTRHAAIQALALAILGAGCVTKVEPFLCNTSDQCAGGRCEPSGFCSVTDETCSTGRRYVAEAGDLAARCVGDEPADARPTVDARSDGGSGGCGDGTQDDGEDCDDGNQADDDGCIGCRWARCGDDVVRDGIEECDDGNNEEDDCTSACLACAGGLALDGHCYQSGGAATDWLSAYQACAAAGGHLATYETMEESMQVGASLAGGFYWIGLSDRVNEGTFTWDFQPLVDSEAHWAVGQPINNMPTDCVSQAGVTGDWSVQHCSNPLPYVCEREPWQLRPETNHGYALVALEHALVAWQSAHTACTARGGHLATIVDAGEQAFVAAQLRAPSWLGSHDMVDEGSFVWVTGESFTYMSWATGEPDAAPGDADCVAIDAAGWRDAPCTDAAARICEVD
jgi:hypothetical protein